MNTVEFVDYTDKNIRIVDNFNITHPCECEFSYFTEEEEYPIQKVYCASPELLQSDIHIIIDDYIYNSDSDFYTVYSAKMNGRNTYVLTKGFLKTEKELVNEITLQNTAAQFGLTDPILLTYILEHNGQKEYGFVMKKYECSLFRIFDSEYYDLETKFKYVDKVKVMLTNLSDQAKICHGDFNLDNIMIDSEDNLKLVDFGKGCFMNAHSTNTDIEKFTKCNFHLDSISEQVTFDLQDYWYKIMDSMN